MMQKSTKKKVGHCWRWVGGSDSEAEDKGQLPVRGRKKSRET